MHCKPIQRRIRTGGATGAGAVAGPRETSKEEMIVEHLKTNNNQTWHGTILVIETIKVDVTIGVGLLCIDFSSSRNRLLGIPSTILVQNRI